MSGTTGPASGASPGPTSSATMGSAEADALAGLLAAEQAAVWAYGVVGAQGAAGRRDDALDALQRHAARRDLVAARLSAAHRSPQPAPPAYTLPFPVDTPTSARALAAHVESAVSAANADLVAATAATARVEPSRWLAESATATREWGGANEAFPGLPERAATP